MDYDGLKSLALEAENEKIQYFSRAEKILQNFFNKFSAFLKVPEDSFQIVPMTVKSRLELYGCPAPKTDSVKNSYAVRENMAIDLKLLLMFDSNKNITFTLGYSENDDSSWNLSCEGEELIKNSINREISDALVFDSVSCILEKRIYQKYRYNS